MKPPILAAGVLLAALLPPLSAARAEPTTLRCDGRLVELGDWDFQLADICGEPYYTERWAELVSVPAGSGVAVSRAVEFEDRYFDRGGDRLLRRVRLREGRIVQIDQLTQRGGAPLSRCTPAHIRSGITSGELVALCGAPARRDALGEALRVGEPPAESIIPTRRERWLYPDGARVTVVDVVRGRVQTSRSDLVR